MIDHAFGGEKHRKRSGILVGGITLQSLHTEQPLIFLGAV
ncbi:hypothetical protein T01_354 [Trichinella spiralis]|uniref:Uncharacterized protein n=1 Tax=Trichinella spiralis TaxID=6334 RepID=A0A0V0YTK4_TRISP|nr:hypothetical protein T01_354 [Trichinella spiralis]